MRKHFRLYLLTLVALITGLAGSASLASDATFQSAATSYRQGNWNEAAAAFADCFDHDRHGMAAQFYWAECQMQLGEYVSARDVYLKVVGSGESSLEVRALFRAGEAAWLLGDAADAQVTLQEFVREHPHDPSAAYAYTYLGDIALESGDPQQAAAAYRLVVDRYSHSSRVTLGRLGLAKSLLLLGQVEQVPVALGRLTQHKDQAVVAEAYLLLGRAAYDSGELEKGLAHFREAYRQAPESPLARRARLAAAWSLWRMGRFDDIGEEISPLFREPQWVADYHYLLGMAAYGKQDWERGIEQLGTAIAAGREHPNRDAMLYYRGECCLQEAQFDSAQNDFQRVIADHPQSPWLDDALWGLARVARVEHDDTAYQSTIAQLRQLDPTSEFLVQLDATGRRNGGPKTVVEVERLLDEAVGLERDGRYDAALATYHELIESAKSSSYRSQALRRAAQLHDRLHQRREARLLYEQFLSEFPTSPHAAESMAALAGILELANETSAARSFRRELVAKFPQGAQAPEAAYWLALTAADEKDSTSADRYVVWLLDELETRESPTLRQQQLWARTVCLQCQLAAADKRWQTVEDAATHALPRLAQGADRVRVEFWLAEAEFRTGQLDEARARFEQLEDRTIGIEEPWVAIVTLRRAQLTARRQQWTEVLKLVERIDREHPDFPLRQEVDYLRGRALAGRGEMNAAREAYARVLDNKSNGDAETVAMAQWMIGETFFHQSDYGRARAAYLAVIKRQPSADWQARAALQAGKCWELENRWDEAQAMYQQALERWPGTEPQAQLQARLKWAESRTNTRRQ